jgi:hypothetical protein
MVLHLAFERHVFNEDSAHGERFLDCPQDILFAKRFY